MNGLGNLIKRNCKLFFKDKGMFFTSLITPAILLLLYVTFLGNVYHTSFTEAIPKGFQLNGKIIDAVVGGQLISSMLAVSCVTVAFCSNMLSVQDKVSGVRRDLTMTPVKYTTLSLAYYASTLLSTLLICYTATLLCFSYLAMVGWYLSVSDVFLVLADVLLLVLLGTAISSIINLFLSSQGQISAVGTVVSAGYGFICGAYMPISSFSSGLQKVISFLPGTYGTSLLRNHCMRGAFAQMQKAGFPNEAVEQIKESIDCSIYFFDKQVELPVMYIILGGTVILLMAIYALLSSIIGKKQK